MFKLLSKESNIFSIPVYIIFLLFVVIVFNYLVINGLDIVSVGVTFAGVSLAYFAFGQINLTYQWHLPLFLYTFFVFSFYSGNLDIGISLFANALILLILTSPNDGLRKRSYLLVGAILGINYIFLPTTWSLLLFVIMHIIATSQRIGLNIFRLFLGIVLVLGAYLCLMYFLDYKEFNKDYLPIPMNQLISDFTSLYFLVPVALVILYGVLNHFQNYNNISLETRFRYTFILVFSLAQLIVLLLYMGKNYEYLLLLAFPASIITSRMIRFLESYWIKETIVWIIIISLLLFKINNYLDFV